MASRILKGLAAILIMLLPAAALAATGSTDADAAMTGIMSKMDSTIAADWMAELFGAAGGSGGSTLIGEMLRLFNVAILAVASILMTYNLFSGVAESTYHGEFLGKNYSTVWVPIRIPLAGAMMFPTANGLSAVQLLMIKMALLGSAMADWTMGQTIDLAYDKRLPMVISEPRAPAQVLNAVFDGAVCRHVANINAMLEGRGLEVPRPAARLVEGLVHDEIVVAWTPSSAAGSSSVRSCGSVAVKLPRIADGDSSVGVRKSVVEDLTNALNQLVQQIDSVGLAFGRNAYPADINGVIETVANADPAAIVAARRQYVAAMADLRQKVQQMADKEGAKEQEQVKAAIKQNGWTRLMTVHQHLMGLTTKYNAALEFDVSSERPDFDVTPAMAPLMAKIEQTKKVFLSRPGMPVDIKPAIIDLEVATGERAWADKLLGALPDATILVKGFAWAADMDTDPILGLQGLGRTLWGFWLSTLTAVTAVLLAAGSVPTMGWSAALIAPAVTLLGTVTTLVLPAAALLSFVLPMTPWLFLFLGALGWSILVVEAVVAGPLWALGHLKMDGHGFTGGVGNTGYMIVLNIVLRPTLMIVFGMIGLAITKVFVPELTSGFEMAMGMVVDSKTTTIPAMMPGAMMYSVLINGMIAVIAAFVYAGLAYYVCFKSMALISTGPDRVLRWIGGGDQDLVGNEGVQKAVGMGHAAAGAGAQIVGQQGAGAVGRIAQTAMANRRGANVRDGGAPQAQHTPERMPQGQFTAPAQQQQQRSFEDDHTPEDER